MKHLKVVSLLYGVTNMNKNEDNQKKNIVLFPGTVDKLIKDAQDAAQSYQFKHAAELFEQVLQHTDGDEYVLSMYAHCLYETKNFARAKDVCEDIIALRPVYYFEVMELYLTVCMQLKQFKQVEKIIQNLFEEGAVPKDEVLKFQRLQALNEEIAMNKQLLEEKIDYQESFDEASLQREVFIQLPEVDQMTIIQDLSQVNIRPYAAALIEIIETVSVHPFVKSLLLILLVEQEVSVDIHIEKLGHKMTVNPATLKLPTQLPQFLKIQVIIERELLQDPTEEDLVQHLIAKHAIVNYPFEWKPYDAEDVALTYIHHVQAMFGKVQEHDYEISDYIQVLEKLSEIP